MTKEQFKKLIDLMVQEYGVVSYKENITDDMTQEEIDDDLWFMTPCCNDMICYDDIKDKDIMDGDCFVCTICEEYTELEG